MRVGNTRKRTRLPRKAKKAPSAGSNAGRGFRYQDRYGVFLAVQGYLGLLDFEELIPEGSDDFELRSPDCIVVIDTKSNREKARARTASEDTQAIHSLWDRQIGADRPRIEYWLVLERPEETYITKAAKKPAVDTRLAQLLREDAKKKNSFVTIDINPHERACKCLVDHIGLAPLVAHLICLSLARLVGELADKNGPLPLIDRKGLGKSDVQSIIDKLSLIFQSERVEALVTAGHISIVDFTTPFDDKAFFLGADAQPGHFASGQAIHRPRSVAAALEKLLRNRTCVVKGPSGSGKSGLMWDIARSTRHNRNWFDVRANSELEPEALTAFITAYSDNGPIGFVIDDIGRGKLEAFEQIISAAKTKRDIWVLGSVRSEDVILVPHGKSVAFLENTPGEQIAEGVWKNLKRLGLTEWEGWKEPWARSEGLLLEYGHILTLGERLETIVHEQVQTRLLDNDRCDELTILSLTAPVATLGGSVKIEDLKALLGLSDSKVALALSRLIEEHLIRLNNDGDEVSSLHALRAEAICKSLDELAYATRGRQAQLAISSASTASLEMVVVGITYQERLNADEIAAAMADRMAQHGLELDEWTHVCRGIRYGRLKQVAEEWFEHASQNNLAPKMATSAALIGAIEGDGFAAIPGAALIHQLGADLHQKARAIALPSIAIGRIIDELENLAQPPEPKQIIGALSALVGANVEPCHTARLRELAIGFDGMQIGSVVDILDAATGISPDIAEMWLGGEAVSAISLRLLSRLEDETPFSFPIITEARDDAVIVEGNIGVSALTIGARSSNDIMVAHCHAMLMLVPGADEAHCRIVDHEGHAALPIDGEKRIPRSNSPPFSIVARNRQIVDAVAAVVGADNWSSYLTKGADLLDVVLKHFVQVLDNVCVYRTPQGPIDNLNAITDETGSLVAPSAPDAVNGITGRHLTPLQNLVFNLNGQLILRFTKLPENAAALAAHVRDLRQRVDDVRKEPWDLISSHPPDNLEIAEQVLSDLETVALEADASGMNPRQRWKKTNGKPRHAFRFIVKGSKKALQSRT